MQDGGHSLRRRLLTVAPIVVAPIVALNALLAFNIGTTAQREISGVAAEILKVAEARLDEAATALITLGLDDDRDCGADGRAALAAAAARVKTAGEVAVVDRSGAAVCSAAGETRVVSRLSAEHATLSPDVMLSLVGVGGTETRQMIRLQWRGPDGTGFRILTPAADIFPYFLKSEFTPAFIAQAVLVDGAMIARKVMDPALGELGAEGLSITASAASQRYPFRIEVATSAMALAEVNEALFLYANIAGVVFAAGAVAVALILVRRSGGPIRELHDGIRRGEFVPYYQPVIDILSGRLAGCEVLVRWVKPDGQVVPPGRFIALAEASGEIFPMTIALMEAARDDLAEIYGARPHLKVGFNLFAGHFDDVGVADDVERIFGSSPIGMNQLMFEVTERQPLQDIARARLVIAKLQALGARVALDDVGTGHGGLSYLLKLGVDVMKMDKMFVDAIGTERYSVAIVDGMVKLAEDMNLDLIAEGVETIEQVEYLRAKGVRLAQGYVFAPPLQAASFKSLVEAMTPVEKRSSRVEGRYVGGLRHVSG
ncbi:MAG: EAL domain-containing protein [Ancylobacter novellus]|uniref:EAL domain-containing protein n=1 Tax=Ancylobacter novellus TaxID=921 RepID=A0A2W5M5S2_ANCNO|nr:MAG: EAL domain-containing protein [Ancylobacter novellus]